MNEREEMAGDVLIAAVEGGIGYWSEVTQYDHGMADDSTKQIRCATATIRDIEEPGNPIEQLTVENIIAAMELIRDDGSFSVRSEYRGVIAEALATGA